jgi:uncharacterized Zn-binding protein involved in type VI secretion
MPQAARLGDPIGHSPTMNYLIAGMVAGAAIAVAVGATVATGGLAAAAILGSGAVIGAGLGEMLSTMSFTPKEECGVISIPGSPNVFINCRAAARAHVDFAACLKHPTPPPPIATGSSTVFVNGMPAARVDDMIACGAAITSGSNNVYIGGGVCKTDVISPENLVPDWVHTTMLVVGVGCAAVLGGPVLAVIGTIGGIGGGYAGNWLGGKIYGQGSDGQKLSMLAGSLIGGAIVASGASVAWRSATMERVPALEPKPAQVAAAPHAPDEGQIATYSGDVYAADFVGPVEWKLFYRGDASARTEFLSGMAQERGLSTASEFLNSRSTEQLNEIFAEHGIGSQGQPTIGVSQNRQVAEYFARGPAQNQSGYVTTFRLESRDAARLAQANYENPMSFFEVNPNIGVPEQEFLFAPAIDPKFIYHQVPVGPK